MTEELKFKLFKEIDSYGMLGWQRFLMVLVVWLSVGIPFIMAANDNAKESIASQSMETSYSAIMAYDQKDNGRFNGAKNGVLIYKEKGKTEGYYAIVTNGEVGEVERLTKLKKDDEPDSYFDVGDIGSFTVGTTTETKYIQNSEEKCLVTFTWSNDGFTDIQKVMTLTHGDSDTIVYDTRKARAVMGGTMVDIEDNVCFYSIGEGSVKATTYEAPVDHAPSQLPAA